MLLNADLGESFGQWQMGNDKAIMPLIDQANIACGYHAGDALVMKQAIQLAKEYNVEIGAHVSYPDLQGFGRRSMQLQAHELIAIIQAQIATLEGLAKCDDMSISYVKPHGALYNDMMRTPATFESVVLALKAYHQPLRLMIQALTDNTSQQRIAQQHQIELIYEAFADRAYTDQGYLQSRTLPKAVLSSEQSYQQACSIITNKQLNTVNGNTIDLQADTLCVHSDSSQALQLCQQIRDFLNS